MVGAAVIGSVAVGAYSADKQSSDANRAARKAGYATANSEERALALSDERYDEAMGDTSLMRRTEELASGRMGLDLGLNQPWRYAVGRDDIRGMDEGDYQSVTDAGYMDWEGEGLETIDPTQYAIDSGAGFGDFIENNAAYDAVLNAGVKAAEGSSAYGGMSQSGSAMRELAEVGQGTASNFYNSYMGLISDARQTNEARNARRIGINENRNLNRLGTNEQRNVNRRNTEEQRYSNYMNALGNQAKGGVTTNMAALGMNQGISSGNTMMASTAAQNQARMAGTAASNAAIGDVAGSVGNMASAYIYANA